MRYFVAVTAGTLAFVAMMACTAPVKEHEAEPVTVTKGRDLAEAVELGEELKLTEVSKEEIEKAEQKLFSESTKLYPVTPIFPEGTILEAQRDGKKY